MKIYRHILTLLLTALLAVGNVTAQTTTGVVVKGNVYGGGNEGEVGAGSEVEIQTGTVEKDVYGGGNKADVHGSVSVTMTGGTVEKDVYGGGALANTNTDHSSTNVKTTTVNLQGGTIKGDAYGGGLGCKAVDGVKYTQAEINAAQEGDDAYGKTTDDYRIKPVASIEATVYGDITVYLGCKKNGDEIVGTADVTAFNITFDNAGTAQAPIQVVKSGRVFGCNNLNGSPQGNVTVNIYKTKAGEGITRRTPPAAYKKKEGEEDYVAPTYEVAAVYGGGNLANYTTAGKKTDVNILNCEVSVESVYGGGNAAEVPETDVQVDGAYEIGYVFGGGNGKDKYTLDGGVTWKQNNGADVSGNTKVLLQGGYIHEAYGGSNEKGAIGGSISLNTGTEGACDLDVVKLVGAGKNADIDGDVIMVLGCMPDAKVDEIYGGADNANVNGNVELTITSGNFGKVFGGNNLGGLIKGHIILNIEETGCRPINIDDLYLGGNQAAYSIYGYYKAQYYQKDGKYYLDAAYSIPLYLNDGKLYLDAAHTKHLYQKTGETYLYLDEDFTKPLYRPRASETDHTETAVSNPSGDTHPFPYADPILNVISCTRIGRVFGGGYGEGAVMYGSPTVNLNMIPGKYANKIDRDGDDAQDNNEHALGEIGGVFGGGDGAAVYGNPTVNIGTAQTVTLGSLSSDNNTRTVEGAYIVGNVYGGGNEANVLGNTQVNVCAVKNAAPATDYSSVTISGTDYEGVLIKGNVFGGGKGVADNFFCNKAMIGEDGKGKTDSNYAEGNTNVIIGNGTVEGTVYGGGEIGRVEMNTTVTIGLQEETSAPVIKGNVFGAGQGRETHGYAALVRGNPTVTVQGHAKAEKNVYGGGEIASVARYNLVEEADLEDEDFVAAHPGLGIGMPYALATVNNNYTGKCTVIVRDHAEVGTETDGGNVFGAGKGILPVAYDGTTEGVYGTSYDTDSEHIDAHKPKRMILAADKNTTDSRFVYTCYDNGCNNVWEYFPTVDKYIEFIQTQALSSQTDVTISGNATVRGSVYGGSENGVVQYDAHVNVTGGIIGVGQKGGVTFGNVFGAGKGYVDSARPENLLAGIVRGNTFVTITDGTILHNVYGGGAYGSVGTITPGSVTYVQVPGQTSVSNMPVSWARKTESETSYDTGTATIKITGGTIGVDGHEDGMVFGSSRGDVGAPGSILDHQAWVYEAHVIIGDSEHPGNTTTPLIRGSIYGSGENGHVFKNAVVDIHGGTIGLTTAQSTDPEGYTGADYLYRGNVYGGGCGTDMYDSDNDGEGDKYNALSGCVLGNATVNIYGGHVVHNVYGAGAMGSVGRTDINNNVPTTTGGKTMITITGGRIGDDGVGDGNVYGAARGELGIGDDLAHVRETEVTIQYSTTPNADNDGRTEQLIAGSVFGGGEAGTVQGNVVVNMNKGLILHDVYGGGALADTQTSNWDASANNNAGDWADATNKSSVHTTQVNLTGGRIIGDLYGGGLGRKADTEANPAVTAVEAKVYGDVTVTTTGGKAARVFGCNNLNGAPQGRVAVNINGTDPDPDELDDTNYLIGNVYGGGNQAAYNYVDHPLTVTMAGGIVNNVFGGGLSADVAGSIAVNVTGGQVINDVYGGGALANTNTANWTDPSGGVEYVDITSSLAAPTYQEKQVKVGDSVSNLYIKVDNQYQQASGTAQSGVTYYELARPSVAGYYLRSDTTEPFTYTLITTSDRAVDNTNYYQKKVVGSWSDGMNGDNGTTYKTTVDLTGGIVGNAYGGGLGDADHAANVYGDVRVTINAPDKLIERLGNVDVDELAKNGGEGVAFTQRPTKFTIGSSTTEHTISVTGHVFGCNNINGTPTGNVAVYVYSTRQLNDNGEIISGHTPAEIKNENEKYEIQGVYGGGNLADYMPAADKKTIVRIDGCNVTSIKKVFGGGNSALVPATDVIITGSHAIGYAFGGGNGGDFIKKNGVWQENEGAIVIGTASIACHGGSVGSVFGGSDAKGVCGGTHIDTTADTGEGACSLKITRIYGAGNEADVNGNVNTIISVCASDEVKFVHGGSYNAHITGNVTLTITSGILQNVYGGNDARGSIGGNITVNIEETETSCNTPIIIQNLVGGGNNAPYPGTNTHGDDLSQNNNWHGEITVNVKSATRIDNVYGGCFNAQANADTEVNINMVKGRMAGYQYEVSIPKRYYDSKNSKTTIPNITYQSSVDDDYIKCTINDEIGTIGNVYGGGKEGKVVGNTTVNIGTATTVPVMKRNDQGKILEKKIVNNEEVESVLDYSNGQNIGNAVIAMTDENVLGAHITDSIYGGGELADVTGNTFVNICAQYNETSEKWESVPFGTQAVTIGGNVYGGGKGKADTFTCEKAMVGIDGEGAIDANNDGEPDNPNGGTTVRIGNGTVEGNVYGGGEIARVEKNSDVTIGFGAGVSSGTPTSAPEIKGDVFGAGKGVATHGYSALLRGNPSVTVQGNAKVGGSVYGGGEIASVARYKVAKTEAEAAAHGVSIDMPYTLANSTSGNCKVVVQGYAEIGPDGMQMTKSGGPDFSGNVFGAGKGILPGVYTYSNNDNKPRRMVSDNGKNSWQYFASEDDYLSFIETLALSSQTDVTIDENAFVKGSVYGGSENGIVQYDTHVKIKGGQIGCGTGQTTPYSDWSLPSLPECDHWPYGEATADADKYAPYDNFAGTTGYDSRGGRTTGDDGHTYYGNVFGGGSGKDPYAPGKWRWEAGIVRGNTVVDITGGHILTNVYGGNEMTDVKGKCTVNFGGTATLGVPRTPEQIIAHPVTCYLFGAGKGDTRTFFNTWTNVKEVELNITGGWIYGSVIGGGEDGHVLENVKVNISDGTSESAHIQTKIGTVGTTSLDGNVFGGGRGFTGEALTAGSIGGNVDVNISGGTMMGNVYGGGRLASVGIEFTAPDDVYYGQLKDDVDVVLYTGEDAEVIDGTKQVGEVKTAAESYGHITMNITGGTIGTTTESGTNHPVSGNVYGGSMGRIKLLNEAVNPLWPKLAVAKITSVNISDNAVIMNNVYGGSEYGIVRNLATVNVSGGTVHGNVFGGGYGSDDYNTKNTITPGGYSGTYYTFIPILWAGCVSGNTNVIVSGGEVKKNVYGGGELASVGLIDFVSDAAGNFTNMPKHTDLTNSFGLSWPYEFHYHAADPKDTSKDGKATVTITGNSKIGTDNDNNTGYVYGGGKGKVAFGTTDDIDEQRYTEAFCANVRETAVTIGTTSGNEQPTIRTVYGGGEDGHVYENATVIINNGTIGNSVFGGGKGTSTYQTTLRKVDPNDPDDSSKDFDSDQTAHSWTAGRVYGNTTVTMNGGSVKWFIYGGGNLGSVGVGNYSGGPDDYSTVGYGELPSENGNLWTTTSTAESETKDDAYHFLNSGIATVNLFGGTVGTGSGTDEYGIPHGSVFGGSRGQAAASCKRSPRYKYVPDFFLGYVNKAIINIGKKSDDFTGDNAAAEYAAYEGPTIYGSVYGGGQDGHVRNSTEVKIYKGEIQGQTGDQFGRSGHVFGAGSGIGTYLDVADNKNKVNNSSGSVTCTTLVEVNGGTIKGSIYGGGALASVGPPKTGGANPNQTYDEKNTPSGEWKSYSYSQVNIKGGSIGGNVFAASRGPGDSYLATNPYFDTTDGKYDATKYATDIWSNVHVSGGKIGYDSNGVAVADGGSVYGGGETGQVKCGVTVNITGGEIAKDVYGGGALAHANTSVWKQNESSNEWGWTDETKKTAQYTTTVNLLGGIIHGDAYGGGLGRKEYGTSSADDYVSPVEATVYGDVKVNLNGLETADYDESIHGPTGIGNKLVNVSGGHQLKDTEKGAIVSRVFGCNNLNGSPQGAVRVHVFATQNADSEHNTIIKKYPIPSTENEVTESVYDMAAVYGGGNLAAYTPMGPNAHDATKEVDNKTVHYIDNDYKNTTQRSEVIIDGCDRTSIKQVYGGSNAASASATYLEVNGTYEIDEAFGGGNGADDITINGVTMANPGANVGYVAYPAEDDIDGSGNKDKTYRQDNYGYGTGVATTMIKGGKIHNVYGGSNKKGNIRATALSLLESMNDDCPMQVDQSYGGGKDAKMDADIDTRMQCAQGVKEVFGGSMNADVNSDITLTITNGSSLERVFGGNNTSGAIAGSITIYIEEGGCEPIHIQELYAGGYLAPYSIYGYEKDNNGNYKTENIDYGGSLGTIAQRIPLTKEKFEQIAVGDRPENYPKMHPRINVISATKIDNIFGGGYRALVVGDPHIDVYMTEGKVEVSNTATTDDPVYKDINGITYTTNQAAEDKEHNIYYTTGITSVTTGNKTTLYATLPIGEIGTIYGGGNLADIYGNTYVEIGTDEWLNEKGKREMLGTTSTITTPTKFTYNTTNEKWEYVDATTSPSTMVPVDSRPTPVHNAAHITGNVFGGGKGVADHFVCGKAMIGVADSGQGNTNVIIGNGTVGTLDENEKLVEGTGNVYGGGQIGRVENNTNVTIGLASTEGISAPVILGNVYGAGKGVNTHGYSALVRGSSTVTVQNKSKVRGSVYGGGEMASVGKYKVVDGLPQALFDDNSSTSGYCYVTIKDDAEIGPDDMQMFHDGVPAADDVPDDKGHVFGAGKGVLPYEGYADNEQPYHMNGIKDGDNWIDDPKYYKAYSETKTKAEENNYFTFIKSLALATETHVKIEGNAFVKGSVYGGSENGFVQHNTHVTIDGNCQIGNGFVQMDENGNYLPAANRYSLNRRYTEAEWNAGHLIKEGESNYANSLPECASWVYGIDTNNDDKNDVFAPHDKFAQTTSGHEEEYSDGSSTEGGRRRASDGHTFYGNVFGGGSGYYPYRPGKWFESAGAVYRNTYLTIKGGHILTSVYGGNEMTDVGKYNTNENGDIVFVPDSKDYGTSYVTMTGGTLGVPRTLKQIAAHPVTCYLFGAGKGDQRIFFNESTDVGNAVIHISDNARIYGSVFGGGEDGHVMQNVKLSIGGEFPALPTGNPSSYTNEQNSLVNIASAYTTAEWAALTGTKDVTVGEETIQYPYIGITGTSYVDGNVFGAGRGFSGDALTAGSVGGNVEVNIAGGTMLGSIYGGGRLASVGIPFTYSTNTNYGSFVDDDPSTTDVDEGLAHGHVTVNISGGTIGNTYEDIYLEGNDKITADGWSDEQWKAWKATNKVPNTEFELSENVYRATHTKGGNVFGGSMGRLELLDGSINTALWPQLGQVKTATINISGNNTLIKSCVYGGGELGIVRDNTTIVVGKKSKIDTDPTTKPTIARDLFGGGFGSGDARETSVGYVESMVGSTPMIFRYTPIMWAGMVGKGTEINIYDGWVKRNVYGGGELASVGIINYLIDKVADGDVGSLTKADVTDTHYKDGQTWKYSNITKHWDESNSFALSWPYKTEYFPGYTGDTYINIYGGRLGVSDEDNIWKDNGDIYGGSKGKAGDRYEMAFCGNVGSSNILIDYPNDNVTPDNYLNMTDGKYDYGCIVGAVYGGGEDGHVMGDTHVTLKKGLIGHALYGGGSGKGKYQAERLKIGAQPTNPDAPKENWTYNQADYVNTDIYSITAGKVYGNTHVKMEGGYVRRFVYGGGNMGSVGKGNYASGPDDYFPNGYGEKIGDKLWVPSENFDPNDPISASNQPVTDTDYFLSSGKTKVEITGGQVGYVDTTTPTESMKDGLPYGSVFGGSRGESAPNIKESPRYLYSPEFFSGYVNEAEVTIGDAAKINTQGYTGPKILGSVFGGGQDGHVRRDTHVIVDAGEIGLSLSGKDLEKGENARTNETILGGISINGKDNPQWLHRGNVYGAGSGIGKYVFDFENDGTFTDANNNGKYDEGEVVDQAEYQGKTVKDIDYSTSAGSVTRFTQVDIHGGTIHRNVYGGGSLSSIGPLKINQADEPYKKGDTTDGHGPGLQSQCTVTIGGGAGLVTIGTPTDYQEHYGGEVYGASRGDLSIGDNFGVTVWTQVFIKNGAHILGNVFGGGDNGVVKKDAEVFIGEKKVVTSDTDADPEP